MTAGERTHGSRARCVERMRPGAGARERSGSPTTPASRRLSSPSNNTLIPPSANSSGGKHYPHLSTTLSGAKVVVCFCQKFAATNLHRSPALASKAAYERDETMTSWEGWSRTSGPVAATTTLRERVGLVSAARRGAWTLLPPEVKLDCLLATPPATAEGAAQLAMVAVTTRLRRGP